MISFGWTVFVKSLQAVAQAVIALGQSFLHGRSAEIARRNAEIAEAERRAAGVPEKSVEQTVRDLDGGGF